MHSTSLACNVALQVTNGYFQKTRFKGLCSGLKADVKTSGRIYEDFPFKKRPPRKSAYFQHKIRASVACAREYRIRCICYYIRRSEGEMKDEPFNEKRGGLEGEILSFVGKLSCSARFVCSCIESAKASIFALQSLFSKKIPALALGDFPDFLLYWIENLSSQKDDDGTFAVELNMCLKFTRGRPGFTVKITWLVKLKRCQRIFGGSSDPDE